MDSTHLHLIVTDEGDYGVSLRSPQVPELVAGRDSLQTLLADLDDILAFAGAPDLPRVMHSARRLTSPEGQDYVIQVARDDVRGERFDAAWRLQGALETDQRSEILAATKNQTGDILFLCAAAGDRLGYVEEMSDEDYVVVVYGIAEELIGCQQMVNRTAVHQEGVHRLEALGLTGDNTIGDMILALSKLPSKQLLFA